MPEGAVVAAFERVDLVEADPMAEIVVGGVDPDRSLADHAFARRLHRRADTFVSIGPGPLVVAPDLHSGVPSDPATRSGRALALQLLGVALARADGLSADRIVVGAYPAWLADEPSAAARIIAEVDVRRALFADHLIRFDEPPADGHAAGPGSAWSFVVAAALARTGSSALLMRRRHPDMATAVMDARAAASTASEVAGVVEPARAARDRQRPLDGDARGRDRRPSSASPTSAGAPSWATRRATCAGVARGPRRLRSAATPWPSGPSRSTCSPSSTPTERSRAPVSRPRPPG